VGRDVLEVRLTLFVATDSFTIVLDAQEVDSLFLAAYDRDMPGLGVDAVLHELGHCFERVALGKGDDANGVPVVADPELTGTVVVAVVSGSRFHLGAARVESGQNNQRGGGWKGEFRKCRGVRVAEGPLSFIFLCVGNELQSDQVAAIVSKPRSVLPIHQMRSVITHTLMARAQNIHEHDVVGIPARIPR